MIITKQIQFEFIIQKQFIKIVVFQHQVRIFSYLWDIVDVKLWFVESLIFEIFDNTTGVDVSIGDDDDDVNELKFWIGNVLWNGKFWNCVEVLGRFNNWFIEWVLSTRVIDKVDWDVLFDMLLFVMPSVREVWTLQLLSIFKLFEFCRLRISVEEESWLFEVFWFGAFVFEGMDVVVVVLEDRFVSKKKWMSQKSEKIEFIVSMKSTLWIRNDNQNRIDFADRGWFLMKEEGNWCRTFFLG